ncbi:hypothetical protein BCR33DRAFT_6805 [Rhizoclosmatium globosum]|uniref:DNA2/NAM7 helicase helicase domain-containing protein n=1 Tax=Rhizoclosmatium globosum TaxID=329046 RepID=A0A1Y2D350_9FUNG|nr:hypothetical protein BCR33DRAFT_6805 [Rhizoclosmatium globosum]|eukprot:ORY53709.1 hypothetical protein BCR33DRAFT_6805 [Rhizoclosmatium globosum]
MSCFGLTLSLGTGKTRVITSLISLLLHTCPTKTILVTAPTHQAVDTILKQFLQAHERNPDFKPSRRKLVRIGTRDTVDPAHWPYLPYNTVNDVETLDKRVYYSSIVFSTTLSAGVGVLATCKFDTVIVDEAAQVSNAPHTLQLQRQRTNCSCR